MTDIFIPYKHEPGSRHPIRMAIRSDGVWVRAFLVSDLTQFQKEISCIRKNSLEADEPLFEAWKKMLTDHLVRWMAASGMPVEKVTEKEADDSPQ